MPEWGELFEGGKRLVGESIDGVTNIVGDGLEYVGAEGAADKVEDWGDRTASSLGAEVGEARLGQSEEPDELVHGKASDITATVKNLRDFQSAFESVGRGLKALDSGRWKGAAADAFREKFQAVPTDWLHAADAFEAAANALAAYGTTVTWAQGKAREAITLYKQGNDSSTAALAAYEKQVAAYEASLGGAKPLPCPAPGTDPGEAQRARAEEILADARRQRNEAAQTAKTAIAAALAHAPAEPSAGDRLKADFVDYALGQGAERLHLAGGVVKGVVGITNFVRSVHPLDAYNLTHPAEYYKNVNMTLAGLASTAAHPDRALKGAWESAKGDPSEFLGRLIPELFGTKGLGGAKTLTRVSDLADNPQGTGRAGQAEDPHGTSRCLTDRTCKGDPVDMATGRMVLPQTDITLPGLLPVVLTRTFESSYRAGRWFGPTWASTLDQRLEIDAEGVVLLCEDSSLLAYPHPAPGVPTLPTHGSRRWTLDRDGDTYTVTDPGTGRVLHFVVHSADLALLAQIDDRNGNWITFEYDETGAPTSVVHHGGYHLKLTTNDGRVTALHLAGAAPDGSDQEILRYGYTDGHLTEVTNSSGVPVRFGCDVSGRITSWTDTNGSRFDYVYDDQDRCTYQSGMNGHLETTFTWDGVDPATGLRLTTLTDGMGHTERHLVNDRAQVVAEIDAVGAVTRYEYDSRNRMLSHTDPLGHCNRVTYDEHGRPTTVERWDGRRARAEYDDAGLPVRVIGTDGNAVRQTFDSRGNRTTVTEPTGATTRYTYDASGHVRSITDALGNTSTVECDAAGLVVSFTDPLGGTTRYVRDAFGRPMTVVDELGATTSFEWTVEGKLARRVDADRSEQRWTYDGEGNRTSHTDALGGVTVYEYTDFDLLVGRTGPDGARYAFAYDSNLRLTQVTDPRGLNWTYAYDPVGRVIGETDFDGRTLTYTYDPGGRLTSRTNGLGQRIRYEHNGLGQVVLKDVVGAVTTFEYDIFDELAQAVGADATLTRLRDRFGRLESETVNGRTVTFEYDALGRRTGRTTPGGAVSAWTYDPAGRRTSLTTSGRTLTFAYDAAGQELARHIGESITFQHSFDVMGRLKSQQVVGGGSTLQRRGYEYREDGSLSGVDDLLTGGRRFELDPIGRVTTVRAENWTEEYVYDSAGNLSAASWPESHPGQEVTGARSYSGTRISRAGSVRYEYDAQGRTVLRQKTRLSRKADTWHYEWDAEDRLVSVTTPEGGLWRYRYDALGRRIAKERRSADGCTVLEEITFTWDGVTLCEERTLGADAPHAVTLTWDHDEFRPLAQTERISGRDAAQETFDERFFAIVTDLVGSPTELVEESGSLAWRSRRTLWGATTWASDSTAYTPLRFPGQYFDSESLLHYNYFRYYDPEISHYVSPDPIGLEGGPNPRWYGPNPYTWMDPLGLALCRAKPRMEDGNAKQGWRHIDERHISGTAKGGHGDLMPPTTTRAQVEAAAEKMVEKGNRVSDPNNQYQTFEKRMTVNGMRANYRLVVDSTDGNRIVTFFPIGKSYRP